MSLPSVTLDQLGQTALCLTLVMLGLMLAWLVKPKGRR